MYQKLLQQSNEEKREIMSLLQEKDQAMQRIIKDREDYKDKYIQSLEQQIKSKDQMLSQVISSITMSFAT
jgi:hypothetical protein